MKFKASRKSLGTAALVFGLTIGGAGISAAATGNLPTQRESNEGPEQSYTSSVTAADNAKPDGLAKISTEQAATAAAGIGGTTGTPTLENENGNIVFTIEVTKPSGEKIDVTVDAGNGSVLAQETADNETSDDSQSATDQGDGDGETNDGPDGNK